MQDEYDEVSAQYKIEKAQLDDLEERFIPLSVQYEIIMEEHDVIHRARKAAERQQLRRITAAQTLQAWWRSYRIRKALAAKEKKLAKLAKKNKGKK